jgi:small subunit ribosomal protein S1
LKFDRERNRVSLGLKQLGEDPWIEVTRRYPVGTKLTGKVTNVTDYGCFVEIEEGIEGLVHVSEMDWTNKNIHPSKVVQLGVDVEVIVLDIEQDRRRVSLGVKQCKPNPWDAFAEKYIKGDRVVGKIKSITDFGIFVGLEGGIDGLVHLADISWSEEGEEAIRRFKKGEELETVVLGVDSERERISLGIKQLSGDPFSVFIAAHNKGNIVSGTVVSMDNKGVVVRLGEDVEGFLKISELSRDRIEDPNTLFTVGDVIEAKYIGVDRKTRVISLSIKAKETQEEQDVLRELNRSAESSGSTLGDLFKERIEKDSE